MKNDWGEKTNTFNTVHFYISGDKDCFGYPLPDDDATLRALRRDCNNLVTMESDIRAYSSKFKDTLTRQLAKYLTGELSNPTPEMYANTQYADPNNIESERTLGMVDAEMRRAPNAKVDMLSGKVKYVKNDTPTWLSDKCTAEQREVMRSAVKQRKSAAKQLKARKARNIAITKQKLYELVLKKEKKKTRLAETKVAHFVKPDSNVTAPDIEREFPTASPEAVQLAIQIVQEPDSIIAKDCTHLWYDKDNCTVEVYSGNVFEYSTKKVKVKGEVQIKGYFTMEYWLPDCPEDSHRAVLTSTELLADLLLSDLLFH